MVFSKQTDKKVVIEELKEKAPIVEKIYQKNQAKKETMKKAKKNERESQGSTTWGSTTGRNTFGNTVGRFSDATSIFSTERFSIPKTEVKAREYDQVSKCPSTLDVSPSPLVKGGVRKRQTGLPSAKKNK